VLRRLTTTALLVAALASVGCQSDANDRASARGAVAGFLRTCNRGQGTLAQQLVVPSVRPAFVAAAGTAEGCARVLGLPSGTRLARARIESVRVADGTGKAVLGLPTRAVRVDLTLTRDGWRVA
jgi:hypothetical protein